MTRPGFEIFETTHGFEILFNGKVRPDIDGFHDGLIAWTTREQAEKHIKELVLTDEQFAALAPKVDANQEYMRRAPNPRNPETHSLPFPDVGNDETGKVKQYRLRRDPPDAFGAYLSGDGKAVTTWTGDILGFLFGPPNRARNGRFVTFSFRMGGRDYHARGSGRGMYCGCKAYKGKAR